MSLNICSKDVYDVCPAAGNKNETYFTIIVVRQTVDAALLTNEPAAAPLALATIFSYSEELCLFDVELKKIRASLSEASFG